MKINVVLPYLPSRAGGGYKIMYEYVNRLVRLGHCVRVYHVMKFDKEKTRYPSLLRSIRTRILYPTSRPKWFSLDQEVTCKTIRCVSDKSIADADILFFTCVTTAYAVANLSDSKGRKVNLVQGYEDWIVPISELHASFRLPMNFAVINTTLYDVVKKESGQTPILIDNAVDKKVFFVTSPIQSRKPLSVCLFYSEQHFKGSAFAIEALTICKEKFPSLSATLFSTFDPPSSLPSWMSYYQNCDKLNELYNSASIFVAPSLKEGWGLPAMEAMFAGCALVCTDVDGHRMFAKDNETALFVRPQSVDDIVDKLTFLFQNDGYRISMAQRGCRAVGEKYTWDKSVGQLETYFKSLL